MTRTYNRADGVNLPQVRLGPEPSGARLQHFRSCLSRQKSAGLHFAEHVVMGQVEGTHRCHHCPRVFGRQRDDDSGTPEEDYL